MIPGLGRPPGGGHGNPLQYSCLENAMDRGAWQATVHGGHKSWTRLSHWAWATLPSQVTKLSPPTCVSEPQAWSPQVRAWPRPLVLLCSRLLSLVRLLATPWTVARQAPLSMAFSRQEYWSGLLFPSPGDLPNTGIKPSSLVSPAWEVDSESPGKPHPLRLNIHIPHDPARDRHVW